MILIDTGRSIPMESSIDCFSQEDNQKMAKQGAAGKEQGNAQKRAQKRARKYADYDI